MEYIATFFTHFGANQFCRSLKNMGVKYRMMPVPRKLSSSCGTCVRFYCDNIEFCNNSEDIEGLYIINGNNYDVIFINK